MRGTFNGSQSPYVQDHSRRDFYAAQEAKRQEQELAERSARWLAGQLGGLEFTSLSGLTEVATQCAEHWHGGLTEQQQRAIKQGCVLLFMGEVTRDARFRLCVERSEAGVRFTEAA